MSSDIENAARKEFDQDNFRAAVEAEKQRLRANAARPWWAKLFPWRIKIERVNHE